MGRRMVLAATGLWLVIVASEWLVGRLFDTLGASVIEHPWAVWLAYALPTAVAAGLIARWRGVRGRPRLVAAAGLSTLAAFAAWCPIALVLMALPAMPWLDSLGEAANLAVHLALALVAVGVAWVVCGVFARTDAHLTSASSSMPQR